MILLYFLLGFVIYSLNAYISNSSDFKQSQWYITTGILLGIIANFCWFSMIRGINGNQVLFMGLYWDLMIVLTFMATPFLFFNLPLTLTKLIGLGMIVIGLVVTKL